MGTFGRTGDDWTADISFAHPQKCRVVVFYSAAPSDKVYLLSVCFLLTEEQFNTGADGSY